MHHKNVITVLHCGPAKKFCAVTNTDRGHLLLLGTKAIQLKAAKYQNEMVKKENFNHCIRSGESRGRGNLGLKQMFKYWNIPHAGYSSFQPTLDVSGNCRSSVNAATKSMFIADSSFVTFCSKTSLCIS